MMAPTATTDPQRREEQEACRKRSRITPTVASQHTVKRQCARKETDEADKTCQPRQKTEKTDESKEQEQCPGRTHNAWGDVGLVAYNPQTTKWVCQFEHCKNEMAAERLTHYHRRKLHPEHSLGGNKQATARPYCSKTYCAQGKLFMHLELAPQKAIRNMEI